MKAGLAILAALLLVYYIQGQMHATHRPGVLVPEEPNQSNTGESTWEKNGYTIRTMARFRVRARVISTERYWMDTGSVLSPVDFALGWGPLSDQAVLDQLSFSQGGRWYRYHYTGKESPIPPDEIISHSANMHMIPANPDVDKKLKGVEAGDIVDVNGYLVQAEGPGGSVWRSSLTRTDTGGGACELVWVESISKGW